MVIVKNVLYVPGLEFNLLSVPKLKINGFKVVFEDRNEKIIKDSNLCSSLWSHLVYELQVYSLTRIVSVAQVKDDEKFGMNAMGTLDSII